MKSFLFMHSLRFKWAWNLSTMSSLVLRWEVFEGRSYYTSWGISTARHDLNTQPIG